jgi:hypothetical protein
MPRKEHVGPLLSPTSRVLYLLCPFAIDSFNLEKAMLRDRDRNLRVKEIGGGYC